MGPGSEGRISSMSSRRREYWPWRRARSRVLLLVLIALVVVLGYESYRLLSFSRDLTAARSSLVRLQGDLDIERLEDSEARVAAIRADLQRTEAKLARAEDFVRGDPVLRGARLVPVIGKQARGLQTLVAAAVESARTGRRASDVLLAFSQHQAAPDVTSIQDAIGFLRGQEAAMRDVEGGLQRMESARARLPTGLIGPLGSAAESLDDAVRKLRELVDGYNRADGLLPELLGYGGQRSYLVLPQNDTELFPSGGLISSYGVATFNEGRLAGIELEYFGTLFDRWQAASGGEYIAPPPPLRRYLLRDYSWALGEAGWYPDFPTTARLAAFFVEKGGTPPTDGTIAIDLQFVQALLHLLGPVEVPEYGVTVTSENVQEVTLEHTRDEDYAPGRAKKAFLSFLAKQILDEVFAVPKDRWVDLLRLLDRMGEERHLQINFADAELQALNRKYGFDGAIVEAPGDYLLLADTSVNSTKLNLILDWGINLGIRINEDGSATHGLEYTVANPFPDWREGRDPRLVRALMLDGVYGSYLRLYAPVQTRLLGLSLNGEPAGPEEVGRELGKAVFGRFLPVLPGQTATVRFDYTVASVVSVEGKLRHYQLYIQKEAGTGSPPLALQISLPAGASPVAMRQPTGTCTVTSAAKLQSLPSG